jgi:hypothetical protein
LVEDDWELAEDEHREADADLLYVTFLAETITIETLLSKINDEGFEAKVLSHE